jgi:hypothetical protein
MLLRARRIARLLTRARRNSDGIVVSRRFAMVAKTLSNLLALVLLVIAANSAATPPKQRVEIANGGFVVNGAAFFPVGFYYIWEMSAPVIGGYPPRTDVRTNTSVWKTGDDFWKDYYATGFNTFTQGWCGSGRDQGYGQMLDYLQKELGTGILPILNVGNTQQVYHGTNAQAKADQAGILAKTFANESFLAYCEHGRPGHTARSGTRPPCFLLSILPCHSVRCS